jgi:hypothetical protein
VFSEPLFSNGHSANHIENTTCITLLLHARISGVAWKSAYTSHIIVLTVHAPTEDKTDDMKDNFYEETERVFDKFPK